MADNGPQFRQAMSRWATGVTVIGTSHDGRNGGLVASSFTSVSADPPTVLVCVDRRSRTLPLLEASGSFSVNVLSSDQEEVFRVFAGMAGDVADKFVAADTPVITAVTGAPILARALAWFDCRTVAMHPGGQSHLIMVGEVESCWVTNDEDVQPLLYYSRDLRRFATLG